MVAVKAFRVASAKDLCRTECGVMSSAASRAAVPDTLASVRARLFARMRSFRAGLVPHSPGAMWGSGGGAVYGSSSAGSSSPAASGSCKRACGGAYGRHAVFVG